MQVIVDRFEGNFIIVELKTGLTVELPKILAPEAEEGDVIDIKINQAATIERKEKIKNIMNQVFKDE